MANLFVYHNNVLADAALVSGSEQVDLSAASYLCDDRLSFKFTATGTHSHVRVDQAGSDVDPFTQLVLIDHTMSGGLAVLTTSPDQARSSAVVAFSGSVGFVDPAVITFALPSDRRYIDLDLTASGGQQLQVGELMLGSRFESPRYPAPGIPTLRLPRRSFIELQNGERQSVRHASVVRQKTYTLESMDADGMAEWVELYDANEGARLVVLTDDEGDTYPALMSTQLASNNDASRFTLTLEFLEVRL
jgi:hypothetical protein